MSVNMRAQAQVKHPRVLSSGRGGDQVRAASDALDAMPHGRQTVLIGATDPMRFHDTRRKVTHMFNYTLGLTRANYLNQLTGNRAVVSTTVLLNDRRGVY